MTKLEIGYNHPFEVRRETCIVNHDSFTVLFLSDLHLNKFSGQTVSRIIDAIQELDPTIILFGGDYVDSKHGANYFSDLVKSISHRSNVFAIAGNHDEFHGTDELKRIAEQSNVTWICNQSVKLLIGDTAVRIDAGTTSDDMLDGEFSILVLHDPKTIEKITRKYNLAFAGHLHGSQFVFWQKQNALYPGKLFYKWNILKAVFNGNPYFISKGLGDTLPIRYNCKRDMVFVEVLGKNQQFKA